MFRKADRRQLIEKEWKSFLQKEQRLLKKYGRSKQSLLDQKLKTVVPEGLREKLEAAFYKAFQVVLQNGTGVIEKTYPKERLETDYKLREYRQTLQYSRKNLKAGPKTAGFQTAANVAGAGIEGAALGFFGIGLPDIPLFLGMVFRSLYTLCLNYGIDYKNPQEQELLLKLLTLSLYRSKDFSERDAGLNKLLFEADGEDVKKKNEKASLKQTRPVDDRIIHEAAASLSGELLYLKFLQGVPIAGVIGGIYDGIYMKRITDYVAVKLERRYLLSKLREQ